jgi:hypothetical protein
MAFELLLPNADDSGWTGGGDFNNIDNGFLNASGTTLDSGGNGGTDETVRIQFGPSAIVTADTVVSMAVRIRCKSANAANETLSVDLYGLGAVDVPFGTTFEDHFIENVLWDVDRSTAQMAAIYIDVLSEQSGMPSAHLHQIDEVELYIRYEPDVSTFGQIVKTATTAAQSGTTFVGDLGRNPTTGNLLVALCCNTENGALTVPSGFTLIHDGYGASLRGYSWSFKVSVGTEQTATYTAATTITNGRITYFEIDWDGSTPQIQKAEDASQVDGTVSTIGTGSATPDGTSNVCLAFVATDQSSASRLYFQRTADWNLEWWLLASGNPQNSLAFKINAPASSQSDTHTDSDTGAPLYGSICCFTVGAAAGALPPPSRLATMPLRNLISR